ncbi:MAG: adenosylcobalamin-dependent ribonucleoside-diphosphate reductase [Planctomycetes bacterium]|nr:adenosylcobalamin-dependent ribonucleoside-diphosphate reductase [Planctomycetota bacterium]
MATERPAASRWGPNALHVLRARYLFRDPLTGETCEAPEDLFRRVARAVAAAEAVWAPPGCAERERARWEEAFYDLMARGVFLPNSPTLMNAGRELGMLSACFVLPVEDSVERIFETIRHMALIQKAGGGTGFDFSHLRPAGDLVSTSGGRASGPVSFLDAFSAASRAIQQGAFRRGANMGILKVTHPDIVEFAHAKDSPGRLTNFNLSVSLPDQFVERVVLDPGSPHGVVNPRTDELCPLPRKDRPGSPWTVGEVFELIAERAWATGEPGVLFIDRINGDNMTPQLGAMEATNPCSEQPLLPYEACTLGSINLAALVRDKTFDWHALGHTARVATRFLDDVVEVNRYPIPETERICKGNRKIGLGVMGFADALYLLEIRYGTDESVRFGEVVQRTLDEEAHAESEALAATRGDFPNWKGSRWDTERRRRQRNAAVTTAAPTGTISIIAGCSGGIEPLFSLAFQRNILAGERLLEVNPIFERVARERGFYSERLVEAVLREGSLRDIPGVPEDVKRVFVTARDVAPADHVRMQAAFQRHCDAAISKTINFPREATVEDVRAIYLRAFREGLKGVTVYRDGSRPEQPMALEAKLETLACSTGCG